MFGSFEEWDARLDGLEMVVGAEVQAGFVAEEE
jgi:hypothetical protein